MCTTETQNSTMGYCPMAALFADMHVCVHKPACLLLTLRAWAHIYQTAKSEMLYLSERFKKKLLVLPIKTTGF